MISPETLRRYGIFAGLTEKQFKALAMKAEQETIEASSILFHEGLPADKFYILVDGSIDLYVKSEELNHPTTRKDFFVGEINAGEIFGISAVLDPYIYTSSAKTADSTTFIEIDAKSLRDLMDENLKFHSQFMHQISKALLQRLNAARVQLAAAWA